MGNTFCTCYFLSKDFKYFVPSLLLTKKEFSKQNDCFFIFPENLKNFSDELIKLAGKDPSEWSFHFDDLKKINEFFYALSKNPYGTLGFNEKMERINCEFKNEKIGLIKQFQFEVLGNENLDSSSLELSFLVRKETKISEKVFLLIELQHIEFLGPNNPLRLGYSSFFIEVTFSGFSFFLKDNELVSLSQMVLKSDIKEADKYILWNQLFDINLNGNWTQRKLEKLSFNLRVFGLRNENLELLAENNEFSCSELLDQKISNKIIKLSQKNEKIKAFACMFIKTQLVFDVEKLAIFVKNEAESKLEITERMLHFIKKRQNYQHYQRIIGPEFQKKSAKKMSDDEVGEKKNESSDKTLLLHIKSNLSLNSMDLSDQNISNLYDNPYYIK